MKRLHKFVLCLLLASGFLISVPFLGRCSEEEIHNPYEVSLSVNAGASFGEVKLVIRQSKNVPAKIMSIDLWLREENVKIPEAAYADLEAPLLGSAQIRSEAGYDEHPWLYIYFELAYRMEDGQWRPKRVHIAYHNGKIEYRAIDTPHPDGSYVWKKDAL